MQHLTIELVEGLLLIAAIVSMLARRVRVPYTVGLVVAGLVVSLFKESFNIELTKQMIYTLFLPPLVFEAAYQTEWRALRRDLGLLSVFVTVGVLIAAGTTTLSMHYLAHWNWAASLVFGILISATDPVSVLATFRELKVGGRLRLLVEAESLLNDGTVAVFFGVVVAAFTGGGVTGLQVTGLFFYTLLGGIAFGAAVGLGVLWIAGKAEDPFVEITFTTVAAFGSFLLAEHFGCSGILSTTTAGILLGNSHSLNAFTEEGKASVDSFWQYAAFVANSLVFLLMGIRMSSVSFAHHWPSVLVAILVVIVGRAISVYLCSLPFVKSRWRLSMSHQHILIWGGLRGALALALSLSLPTNFPDKEAITAVAFAVVAFSVLVQGISIAPLMRRLNEAPVAKTAL